jgi:hypothetical protein
VGGVVGGVLEVVLVGDVVGGVSSVGVGEVGVGEVGVGEVGVGVDGFLVGAGLSGSVHGGVVLVGGFTGSGCVVVRVGVLTGDVVCGLCVGAAVVVTGSGVWSLVGTGTWVGSSSFCTLPSLPVGCGTTPVVSGIVTVELL